MIKYNLRQLRTLFVLGLIAPMMLGCSLIFGPSERPDDAVVTGINYIAVTVSDLESATKRYSEAFNLNEAQTNDWRTSAWVDSVVKGEAVRFKTRVLRGANGQIRLFQFESPSALAQATPHVEVNGPGIAHICMQVDAKTRTYEKFIESGAQPVGDPEMVQLNPRNPVYYAYARDQDGVMFEVEHVDVEKLDLPSPPKNTHRMRHVALASPDIDSLVEFYSVLLQQRRPRRLGVLSALSGERFDAVSGYTSTELQMAFFDVRNMELEIAEYLSHPPSKARLPRPLDAMGHSLIMFNATDLAKAKQLVLAAGGNIVPTPSTFEGQETMLAVDPDGNLIGFQMLTSNSPLSADQFKDNGI